MENEFEITQRPSKKHGPRPHPIVLAVLESATTGQAIRWLLNGANVVNWRNRLSIAAKLNGLQAHVQIDGDHLIAWATPREP